MGRTCFVPLCKTGHKSQKKEKISLFHVPKNKLAEWQKIIPCRGRALNVTDMICEKHFLKEYICREINNELFMYPLSRPKLTTDAIPTIFPGGSFSLSKKTLKRRLVQEHETPKTKTIKLEQVTPDISVQDENEAEVAMQNSSEVLEFRDNSEFEDNFEFKYIPPCTILLTTEEFKSEQVTPDISAQEETEVDDAAVQSSSEVLEFRDNFKLEDNLIETILPMTKTFKSEQVTPGIFGINDSILDIKTDENEAEDAVQNSSEVLELRDNIEFKDNLLDTILPTTKKFISTEQVTPEIFIKNENDEDNLSDPIFLQLLKNISIILLPSVEWAIHKYVNKYAKNVNRNLICFSEMIRIEDNNMIVRKKLVISKDTIKVFVFDHMIDSNIIFSNENVNTLAELQDGLNKFNNMAVCCGGLPIRDLQSGFKNPLYLKDHHLNVWRHVACSYVLPTVKDEKRFGQKLTCSYCKKNSKAISNFIYHQAKKTNKITRIQKALKNAANVQKRERKLRIRNEEIMQKLKYAQKKIKELEEESLEDKISNLNLSTSQKLLLQECINSSKHNHKTSRRYNSEWLLICSLLQIRSPVTYRFLLFNDILSLPAVSTIKKYLPTINIKCGLDEKFFESFKLKMQEKDEYERHGILIFNEMQVGDAINLNIKTMKLYGVPDFGEKRVDTAKTFIKRAHHALVFMFVSFASPFCQPIVIYTTEKPIKDTRIAKLTLEVINNLEKGGAVVDGIVCKGASTSRKMWAEFGISGDIEKPVNKIKHPFDDSRFLHFFTDAPHLIKCLRDRLLMKSTLMTPDGIVKWSFYEKLFCLDRLSSTDLPICPKLTEMHISPSDLDKKRVNLATQIFSNSVADGLDNYKQKNADDFVDSEGTINFTRRINYLFDALNRRDPIEGMKLESKDFEMLQENLIYLNSWENMLVKGEIKTTEFLNKYTADGLRITILSTIELAKYLLNCGFQYVLSSKFNQDPLEAARTR